jgi:hypothetical protein
MVNDDRPIINKKEDLLHRDQFVEAILAVIQGADVSHGALTVGLLGSWGSGKTSLLNLLSESLSESSALSNPNSPVSSIVVKFDPWILRDADQLTPYFLRLLARQLAEKDIKKAARHLRRLSRKIVGSLSSVSSLSVGIGGLGFSARFKRSDGIKVRDSIVRDLGRCKYRIVVLLDDLDRLQPDELTEVFRMVRAVADFPNIVYILAFDRDQVLSTLNLKGLNGSYLDKIIQRVYEVPKVESADLLRGFDQAIDQVIAESGDEVSKRVQRERESPNALQVSHWAAVMSQLGMVVRSLRDVNRVAASLPPILSQLVGEVAIVDLIALATLQVVEPEVHKVIVGNAKVLTDSRSQEVTDLGSIDLVELAPELKVLLQMLFPMVERALGGPYVHSLDEYGKWREEGRVGNRAVLNCYIYFGITRDYLTASLLSAFLQATDVQRMLDVLDSVPKEALGDLMQQLCVKAADDSIDNYSVIAGAFGYLYERLLDRSEPDGDHDLFAGDLLNSIFASVSDVKGQIDLLTAIAHPEADVPMYGRLHALAMLISDVKALNQEVIQKSRDLALEMIEAALQEEPSYLAGQRNPLVMLSWACEQDGALRARVGEFMRDSNLFEACLSNAIELNRSTTTFESGFASLAASFGGEDRLLQWMRSVNLGASSGEREQLRDYLQKRCFDPFDGQPPFGGLTQSRPDSHRSEWNSVGSHFSLCVRAVANFALDWSVLNAKTRGGRVRDNIADHMVSSQWLSYVEGIAAEVFDVDVKLARRGDEDRVANGELVADFVASVDPVIDNKAILVRFAISGGYLPNPLVAVADTWLDVKSPVGNVEGSPMEHCLSLRQARDLLAVQIFACTTEIGIPILGEVFGSGELVRADGRSIELYLASSNGHLVGSTSPGFIRLSDVIDLSEAEGSGDSNGHESLWSWSTNEVNDYLPVRSLMDACRVATRALRGMAYDAKIPNSDKRLRRMLDA